MRSLLVFTDICDIEWAGLGSRFNIYVTDGWEVGRQHGICNFSVLFQRCYTFNSKGRIG